MAETKELLESFFNEKAKVGSKNYFFHCPKCNHHKRKLLVGIDNNQWHCWICENTQNTKGQSLHSLFRFFNASQYYLDAVNKIEKYKDYSTYDIDDPSLKLFGEDDYDDSNDKVNISLPKEYTSFMYNKGNTLDFNKAFNYLTGRNIRLIDIVRYNIGYCDSGSYKNRIIIPSYDKFFRLNYFIARSYNINSTLKYDNPNVDKTKIIFFESFLNWSLPITIVEGAFDAIPVRYNVTSLLGSSLNESHRLMKEIMLKKPPQINLILDPDAIDKAIYISELLLDNDINTKLIILNGDKDPNQLGFQYLYNAIKKTQLLDFNGLMKLKLKM